MNKKSVPLFVLAMVFITFLAVDVFAFKLNNSNIEKNYAPGEKLKGWLNISFQNENIDSKISSSFTGEIKLIDFLDINEADYSCIPEDCNDAYVSINGTSSKSFSLTYGQEKILSLLLNGNIQEINSLSFDVSVTNPSSCMNPLEIDVLDDGVDWKSRKVSNEIVCTYELGRGCFNVSASSEEVEISTTPYCEKVGLMSSEKFLIGAWVKKVSTAWSPGLLKMFLYDLNGNELKSCDLPEPSSSGGEISCAINYSNALSREYYVCLKATSNTDYKTKKESSGTNCGFFAIPGSQQEYHDYYIFAKAAKFDNIGNFVFNQEEYERQGNVNLANDIKDYVSEKYGNNCSSGCSIPIKFKAYGSLSIEVKNLSLRYSTGGGATTTNSIYDTSRERAKLNSNFILLDLNLANISVPSTFGNHTLKLYLNSQEILPEPFKIRVENVPVIKSLFPLEVPAGVPTKFSVSVSAPSGRNISVYRWDFGDEEEENTTKNFVTHAYPEIDEYNLTIEIEDNLGYKSSKTFTINAVNPKENVNSTILKYKTRLSNLTSQIAGFGWYKDEVKELVGIDELNSELQSLERKYNSATSDEEYAEIMGNLTGMRVPYSVKESIQESMPFFISSDEIELEKLEILGAGSFDENEEAYKKAITSWTQKNLDIKLDFKYVSAYYDDVLENLLSVYNLEISPAEEQEKELYLVINDKEAKFNGEYRTRELDDSIGLILAKIENKEIEFYSEMTLDDLIVYLSPEFNLLEIEEKISPCNFNERCEKDLGENWRNCRSDCKPWGWVILFLIMLLIAGIGGYIFLQWWYKEKYESHLFKNRNDLYNLMTFISNAKSQGLQENEIARRLKQAGWSGEQISYVFKKMGGKAIMPLDFLKLFRKLEKEKLKTSQPSGKVPFGFNQNKSL